MQLMKAPIAHTDEPFLLTLYSTTREEELAVVPWSDEQKREFLQMQFQAQHQHYITKFPDASFQIIKLDDQFVGRLYVAERENEIRILDLTILPEFRNRNIGLNLLKEILQTGHDKKKPVQIYLEPSGRSVSLFLRLGFEPVAEAGFYQLWRWTAQTSKTTAAAALKSESAGG